MTFYDFLKSFEATDGRDISKLHLGQSFDQIGMIRSCLYHT